MAFKKKLLKVPAVGRAARIAKQTYRLPERQTATTARLDEIERTLQAITKNINQLLKEHQEISKQADSTQDLQDTLQKQLIVLDRHLQEQKVNVDKPASAKKVDLFAEDHLMDVFYTKFEDRFRGSEEIIMKRLEEYLPYFKESKLNFTKNPVLDIGSGRGEFLQVLKKNKINSLGLDINLDMVKRANDKGLKTEQGDALSYLEKSGGTQKYGAITGFHIVEHIPFGELLRIFSAARRALVKNGFVLFETPNPENILVGTHSFYLDPSHLHPLPPELLAFAFEVSGFKDIEIKRLHPDSGHDTKGLPKDVASRLYGPRDYAVIAYKY